MATEYTQVRVTATADNNALEIAAKVNAHLAQSGLTVSKRAVYDAAMNEFYKECAQRSGEDFAEWIAATFKGEF